MKMTRKETQQFYTLLHGWADTPEACKMHDYMQHGKVSTYEHCLRVAMTSFWLNRRLHLGADEESLVRGAFLHDFYLYDWHDCDEITRWHGFTHPAAALKNARENFPITDKEENIILSHMWPLTITKMPRCREAVVVCMADKGCGLKESILERKATRQMHRRG